MKKLFLLLSMRSRVMILLSLVVAGGCFWNFSHLLIKSKLSSKAAPWMLHQIQQDFAPFLGTPISKSKIVAMTDQEDNKDSLVRYEIKNNKVRMIKNFPKQNKRANSLHSAFQKVCDLYSLPDMDFIVSLHDAIGKSFDIPIFVMAKNKHNKEQILVPDFDSLRGKYQILKNQDITKNISPRWEMKKNQLVWRGNSSQSPNKNFPTIAGDSKCFSRVMLSELSLKFPSHIDAKITRFVDGWENLPNLEHLHGGFISYDEQLKYKYQMLIDGYTCSYSNSGWKWFSNSLVFKEDSDNIQWYYSALKPYEHFIPVKEGLEDLVEKITWAQEHDTEAKEIAARAREFALNNITKDKDLVYIYHLLLNYSALNFVD